MFKHTTKMLALLFVFASIALFISCQEQQPVAPADTGSLSKVSTFGLLPGETLQSASLKLYTYSTTDDPIEVHNITADWTCPSWNSFAGAYDANVITTFNPAGLGFKTVDITSTVQAWLNCATNNGVLLKNESLLNGMTHFWSNDYVADPNLRPYLYIVTNLGTYEVEPLLDTYIYERDPDLTYCNEEDLAVGRVSFAGDPGQYEKQTLIRFDLVCTPPEEVSCETSYAFDDDTYTDVVGTCFIDLGFGNWGWSIYLPAPGIYTFPVYAGAGQCEITKGTYVGDVTADYSGGTVSFEYDFEDGFEASETHFYAGLTPIPLDKKDKQTVAPGAYKIGTNLGTGPIYIIAHAVVCSSDWDD